MSNERIRIQYVREGKPEKYGSVPPTSPVYGPVMSDETRRVATPSSVPNEQRGYVPPDRPVSPDRTPARPDNSGGDNKSQTGKQQ